MSERVPDRPDDVPLEELSADELLPVRVNVLRVIEIGIGCWVVALVATLIVPALHHGDRDWWPWACVAGALLGGLAWTYVHRGRGNASAA